MNICTNSCFYKFARNFCHYLFREGLSTWRTLSN